MSQRIYLGIFAAQSVFFAHGCVTPETATPVSKSTSSHYRLPNEAHCNRNIKSAGDAKIDEIFKNLGVKDRPNERIDVGDIWDTKNTKPDEYCYRKICDPKTTKCVELGKMELKKPEAAEGTKLPPSVVAGDLFKKKYPDSNKSCSAGDLSACMEQFINLPDAEKETKSGLKLYAKFCDHRMFKCFKLPRKPTEEEQASMKEWSRWSSQSITNGEVFGYSLFQNPDYKFLPSK